VFVDRKDDQKQIEEMYLMFKKHFAKLKKDDAENINTD